MSVEIVGNARCRNNLLARLGRLPLECHAGQQCFERAALLLQQGVELPVGLAAAQEVHGCHHGAPAARRSGREFLAERLRERGDPANTPKLANTSDSTSLCLDLQVDLVVPPRRLFTGLE